MSAHAGAVLLAARDAAPKSARVHLVELGCCNVRLIVRLPWWRKLVGTRRVQRRVAQALEEVRPVAVAIEVVVL